MIAELGMVAPNYVGNAARCPPIRQDSGWSAPGRSGIAGAHEISGPSSGTTGGGRACTDLERKSALSRLPFQHAYFPPSYRREPWYAHTAVSESPSIASNLAPAEAILIDAVRMIVRGRSDELPARIKRHVHGRSRQSAGLSPAARAALAVELADERVVSRRDRRMRTAAEAGLERAPDSALLPAEESHPPDEAPAPVFAEADWQLLERVIDEYQQRDRLAKHGLAPTRTLLLSGPPGVGKSMTIQYLAARLGRPVVRLEPAAVIGSLLGESARLLSAAFERARSSGAVMVLDEVDALAKRRDDVHDVGEFKRFVSTLLLELDRWPAESLLIAATNHFELLDPALERRFELHVRLSPPDAQARREILERALNARHLTVPLGVRAAVVSSTEGATGAWLESIVTRAARRVALGHEAPERVLLLAALPDDPRRLPRNDRVKFAGAIRRATGMPFREIGELFGCSHTAARGLVKAAEVT